MHDKNSKTRQIISAVIVIILVVAMVLPMAVAHIH